MTPRECGMLLLTSCLGDPNAKPLTVAQYRELFKRVRAMERPTERRELQQQDLIDLGYDLAFADRVIQLLSRKDLLNGYIQEGQLRNCVPITRLTDGYPDALHRCMGIDAPGTLWAKGDLEILDTPKIALVGSRNILPDNQAFAREVGKQAALQGYTLVSGNASGADAVAQESCLAHGGRVISVLADEMIRYKTHNAVLYLCEDSVDLPMTAWRALSRNRVIHCLGEKTFVAQCRDGSGGTWDGTTRNLKNQWSPVYCYRDGSDGSIELERRGAALIDIADLQNISQLQ